MKRVKSVKAAPGARRLIESLRDLGYETSTAVADLIDNSISADSSKIYVEIRHKKNKTPAHIVVVDNGKGMNADELKNAMRFGSTQDYAIEDLGKYGLGLKTASLSQCAILTVISKKRQKSGGRSRIAIAEWNLTHINSTDDWDLLVPDKSELQKWQIEIVDEFLENEGGTICIWSDLQESLPLLASENIRKSEQESARLITECANYLRMVFHRFIEGRVPSTRKLYIQVGGQDLEPWDPFCRSEKKTKEMAPEKFNLSSTTKGLKGQKYNVTFQPYILPHKNDFSTKEAFSNASGVKSWNLQQGFYFYRNNRLIQSGGWSRVRAADEHTKLLRIAVDFNSGLDDSLSVNITKMKARIPSEIREEIKNHVKRWIKPASDRYRGSSNTNSNTGPSKSQGSQKHSTSKNQTMPLESKSKANTPTSGPINFGPLTIILSNTSSKSLSISKGTKPGHFKIIVPHGHPSADLFNRSNSIVDDRQTSLILLTLIECVVMEEIDSSQISLDSLRRQVRKST